MKNGSARFEYYLDRIGALMIDAGRTDNAAAHLYSNGARTPLFMLEALARLYGALHNRKKFARIEHRSKAIEDGLGAIDFYDGFGKDFAADKAIPASVKEFITVRIAEETAALDAVLEEQGWVGNDADRVAKIRKKLKKIDWLGEKKEVASIAGYYEDEIARINAFYANFADGFTDLESQVHELRRKLRWLSIFPQALQGCIQLTEVPSKLKALQKYLTPEVVSSPFNKLPDPGPLSHVLTLDRDRFYALSWMIAELGRLKDAGLRIQLLNEAGIRGKDDAAAIEDILRQASAISSAFFAERNLDTLVAGEERVTR
jgi:hypothetical protein